MSLRRILDLFRAQDWNRRQMDQVLEMLDLGRAMFGYAVGVIVHGEADHDAQAQIYRRDQRINELEQEVRRGITSRLATSTAQGSVPTGLILMNVVKDVERIGDYMKNFYEISHLLPESPDRALYRGRLAGKAAAIEEILAMTREAFSRSEPDRAQEAIRRARSLGKETESAIAELAHGPLPTADAVCLVLSERFFKRIAMHLANIATSVVTTVDRLDFFD
jgi:phosphate transport system protein